MIGAGEIFTIFFVTLGPLKMLGPFAQRTRDLDDRVVRAIAVRAFIAATLAVVIGSLIGRIVLGKWHVSVEAMLIAAGIIFFLVALKQLLEQYEPPHTVETAPPLPASPLAAALRLLFPIVLTPYGIAAVIVLLATSHETTRSEEVLAIAVAVMALNLLAMLFARRILVGPAVIVLQVLGAVLGVMQAGLAIQFVLVALQRLHVIPA